MNRATFCIATASQPGAIGIVQLYGPGVVEILRALTGRMPEPGRVFLAHLSGIDEGLVVTLGSDWAQVMPHGGLRVMEKIVQRLRDLGASICRDLPAGAMYPEASTRCEADMLATLARAVSPAAIDLLLEQPRIWHRWLEREDLPWPLAGPHDPRRHLIDPPTIALIGRANVGKSTLSNLVLGRSASITADLPGTTRDWVAGLAELPTPVGDLAVRWVDTPGIRDTSDPVESRAVKLAAQVIGGADVLIAVRDPFTDWAPLPSHRPADIHIVNKSDLLPAGGLARPDGPAAILVSAIRGEGLQELGAAVAHALGLTRLNLKAPWAFSSELYERVHTEDRAGLLRYCLMADAQRHG